MGKFIYGAPSISVDIDDRVLAHLKVVIVAKLRRGESFTFSWHRTAGSGSGHSSVWLNPSVPLEFDFAGSKAPTLNKVWLDELVHLANSPAGLRITPEPSNGDGSSQGDITAT
ncbi:MAG: ATP-dependent DNA ligase [Terrimesophilobacter sp.]